MKLTGNTILITGGGSGIGRGFAEALHKLGNKVIIAGRRRSHLNDVIAANPGMEAVELDIADPASIDRVAATLIVDHPELNVLINNAGIMQADTVAGKIDDALLTSTISTNLMGPIRMTSALIEHLKSKDNAVVAYTTSALAFVPMAVTGIYSSTKAALHSYILSQRFMLRHTGVRVIEIAPPWVRTELMNSQEAEQAMPLDQFIAEAMTILGTDADEIVVEAAKMFRANVGPGEHDLVNGFNEQAVAIFGGA
ncbi:SDR family oxidoreductase [Dyella subtropica]|uniref:SDR family oxidoreductase n=1 Tax=Dyella subtropica TaxID=2992127 RepID=UPI00225A28C3|nr:SDR family NAD(P)-dependent oxidoreductase [Dyella subtropica]